MFDDVSPEILMGAFFRVAVKVALEEIMAGCFQKERDPTSEGLETLVAAPEEVVAPPSERWTNWEEQVD